MHRIQSFPFEAECEDQVICIAFRRVFVDLAYGRDTIVQGEGNDQQKDFIKRAIINLADKNGDEEVDFEEFRMEGIEILRIVFNMFDRNSDNGIDKLETTIDNIGQGPIKTAVNLIFRVFDQNQDNFISTNDIPNKASFDENEDGTVTLNEVLSTISDDKITNTIYLPKPLQQLLNILDSNKDEQTSVKEIENFINVMFKMFNVFDKNKDCFVKLDELLEVMEEKEVRNDFRVAVDIIASQYIKLFQYLMVNLIEKTDKNGNEKLDFEEIVNFKDLKLLQNSLKTAVSLGHPNLSAIYYLMGAPGGPDRFGRPNWELSSNKNAAQESLAEWLSFADGLLRDPSFFKENQC